MKFNDFSGERAKPQRQSRFIPLRFLPTVWFCAVVDAMYGGIFDGANSAAFVDDCVDGSGCWEHGSCWGGGTGGGCGVDLWEEEVDEEVEEEAEVDLATTVVGAHFSTPSRTLKRKIEKKKDDSHYSVMSQWRRGNWAKCRLSANFVLKKRNRKCPSPVTEQN